MKERKIIKIEDTGQVESLFRHTTDTVILSCLQKVMGEIYATDDLQSAMAILGDFCFYVGIPSRELIFFGRDLCTMDSLVMVPENEEWGREIEQCLGSGAERITRYAIKKEGIQVFDRKKLEEAVKKLPVGEGYELRLIDQTLYEQIWKTDWCREWVENYPSYELFEKAGMGAVILKDGEPIAGASSFSGYLQGIEITIRTKEEYRRQGLAHICAARLILECINKGLYPSWDAANLKSVSLSEKLGYHFDKEYVAYRVKL